MTPLERPEPGLTLRMKAEARRIANQHSRLEELRGRVTAEISRLSLQTARSAFERFAVALEDHFAVEEKFFLPALGSLDPEVGRAVEELLGEHQLLRRRVSDLMDHFAAGNGFACAILLDALIGELRAHERDEERVLARADQWG